MGFADRVPFSIKRVVMSVVASSRFNQHVNKSQHRKSLDSKKPQGSGMRKKQSGHSGRPPILLQQSEEAKLNLRGDVPDPLSVRDHVNKQAFKSFAASPMNNFFFQY